MWFFLAIGCGFIGYVVERLTNDSTIGICVALGLALIVIPWVYKD